MGVWQRRLLGLRGMGWLSVVSFQPPAVGNERRAGIGVRSDGIGREWHLVPPVKGLGLGMDRMVVYWPDSRVFIARMCYFGECWAASFERFAFSGRWCRGVTAWRTVGGGAGGRGVGPGRYCAHPKRGRSSVCLLLRCSSGRQVFGSVAYQVGCRRLNW